MYEMLERNERTIILGEQEVEVEIFNNVLKIQRDHKECVIYVADQDDELRMNKEQLGLFIRQLNIVYGRM